MGSVQHARIKKTRRFISARRAFLSDLRRELGNANLQVMRTGQPTAARLNVFSDVAWHRLIDFEEFGGIMFYDYTKSVARMREFLAGALPANYHLIFSRSENTPDSLVREILAAGGNVAVPFLGGLPATFLGAPVIDGDETDLRFLDPRGVIVGLKAKGARAKRDTSGFIVLSGGAL